MLQLYEYAGFRSLAELIGLEPRASDFRGLREVLEVTARRSGVRVGRRVGERGGGGAIMSKDQPYVKDTCDETEPHGSLSYRMQAFRCLSYSKRTCDWAMYGSFRK